jgi:hypothetical protein
MRRPAAALPLAALALTLAACGGSKSSSTTGTGGTADATAAVRDAVRKTIGAGSEHVAVSASARSAGQTVTVRGNGDFDSARRRGRLQATVSLGGVQTALDEVLAGSTAYAQSPLLKAFLPAGKSWLKVDLAAAGKTLGVDTSVLRSQDPAVALGQLKALNRVRTVGTGTVGGTAATHYRGTIDVAKLPKGSAGVLSQSGTTLGPVDVWVGDDGYVRRERLTTSSTSGQGSRTVVTMTLSKFGEPVVVSVPADTETVDASTIAIPGLGG